MGLPAQKWASYEDLFDLPDHLVGEIVAGELYTSPRPALRHATSASVLSADLGTPFMRGRGGPGGWWILAEPELHLGSDILVPDLAGWRRSRLPEIPDDPYLTLAPDWVCEIHSPSTIRLDRIRKLPIYAREGVKHAWLVDPGARTLEILRLEGERWVIVGAHGGDARVRAEPFEAVELDLVDVWGEGRGGPSAVEGSEPGQ